MLSSVAGEEPWFWLWGSPAHLWVFATDGTYHSSADYKPICKIGFSPAEAQILKLRMISAKDSQKEGQP